MIMKRMLTLALACALGAAAQAQPLWMRYNAISPDGTRIAFAYKGDIYVVDAQGGTARQLTTAASLENHPVWSPDSRELAFASDRNGNADIYAIDAEGGQPRRVTTHSAAETPLAYSPDGEWIYYSAAIQKQAANAQISNGWLTEVYKAPRQGGRPQLVTEAAACSVDFDADGESFLYYNRTGSENIWRKHHTSSVARDIFRYDAATGQHQLLSENPGEDRDPRFLPGRQEVVFLSERGGGSFNVYRAPVGHADAVRSVTAFEQHPVRFLTVAADGTLCYNYMGEIYTHKLGEQPRKVPVEIRNDQESAQVETLKVTRASGYDITPDGKQVAVVARGDIFATTDEFATTKQVTATPTAERGASFAPDGRALAYAAERGGRWGIYLAKIARGQEPNFANATLIDEQPLFDDDTVDRFAPKYSPDGRELAYIEGRNILKVINLETKAVRQITDGRQHARNDHYGFAYEWSPCGSWFALELITNRRDPYSDIGVVDAKQGGEIRNITNTGYIDAEPRWALDGQAITFTSNRLGMRSHASWGSQDDIFAAFLTQEAYDKFRLTKEEFELQKQNEPKKDDAKEGDKKKKKGKKEREGKEGKEESAKAVAIEWEGIEDRTVRLTPMSSNLSAGLLSADGEKLFFLSAFEKGHDLWEVKLRERQTKLVKKLEGGSFGLALNKKGDQLYIFSASGIKKMPAAGGDMKSVGFDAQMRLDLAAEREYMFWHVIEQQKARFYTTDYHGVDLDALAAAYAPQLPHVSNNADFAELLSEVLGELNVSHTGSGYRPASAAGDATAQLGLLFDWRHAGDGLLISEVVKRGPFDTRASKAKAGHVVEKIDGAEIKAGADYFPLLNNKAGRWTLVSLLDPATGERWDEAVKPISRGKIVDLQYRRWVERNRRLVDSLSGGRLGYVHIQSMGDASYRDVYSDILGRYNLREGIVIDTRFNGGGRLHEDIEILFSGEKYLEQVIRGQVTCDMPSRRYNKPSIMVVGEANYSNAHGTPWVYRHKKMGKIVGMPVPGTMTSVNWETLQDPTLYFGIPVIGYRTRDGKYLENSQLEPDIKVRNTPEKLAQGIDEQLEAAVRELLKEADAAEQWPEME